MATRTSNASRRAARYALRGLAALVADDAPRGRESLLSGERGFMSAVNVVAVLFCSILIGLVTNASAVSSRKVELQNTADAVAYSGAVWQARGMNAITATNHMMGEILSFVIVHEGLGGEYLDEYAETGRKDSREEREPDQVNVQLRIWKIAAEIAAALNGRRIDGNVYDRVLEEDGVHAEATLRDAKVDLKRWLCLAYRTRAIGEVLAATRLPIIAQIGEALVAVAQVLEQAVGLEYAVLDGVDAAAVATVPVKKVLRDYLLPQAKNYTDLVVASIPRISREAAEKVAEQNGAEGMLLPMDRPNGGSVSVLPMGPNLPVRIDPIAGFLRPVSDDDDDGGLGSLLDFFGVGNPLGVRQEGFNGSGGILGFFGGGSSTPQGRPSDQVVRATQLARATWPWVCYHRHRVFETLRFLTPLSGAESYYLKYTTTFGNRILIRMQTEADLALYVMQDQQPLMTRGFEDWVEGNPTLADDLFTVFGMARRGPPPLVSGPGIYASAHPEGMLSFSQAIVYNANEQIVPDGPVRIRRGGISPDRQARVGWDTLNWEEGEANRPVEMVDRWPTVRAFPGGFLVGPLPFPLSGFGEAPPPNARPRIKVNWQAKLVPVTKNRLGAAQAQVVALSFLPGGAKAQRFRDLLTRIFPAPTMPDSLLTH